jgi:hypothetical protein
MILNSEADKFVGILASKQLKRLRAEKRKTARERDSMKTKLSNVGLNFINIVNFISFETVPIYQ